MDPVEEAAVGCDFHDCLILMVNEGKKAPKIGKNYGNIRGIYIYTPYGSKCLLRKYLGYDLGVKYLLRQCLDP